MPTLSGIKNNILTTAKNLPDHFAKVYNNAKANLWNSLMDNAPSTLDLKVAYARLERHVGNNTWEDVGTIVGHLHKLAERDTLKDHFTEWEWLKEHTNDDALTKSEYINQRENYVDALKITKPALYNSLYREDGTRKTSFELATIASNIANKDVAKKISTELQYRVDNNLPLPPDLFKIRFEPDYLQNLKAFGLRVKGKPNQVSIDLDNNNPSTREQLFHLIFPWLAFIVTLTTAMGFGIAYPIMGVGIMAGLACYVATTSGEQFGFFDKAQDLLRILNWSQSSEFPFAENFNWRNLPKILKSTALLASIGFFAATIAMGAFSGIMALPFLAAINPFLQLGLASCVAGITALGTTLGCFVTTNYNFGISVANNQFPVTKDIAQHLNALTGKKCLTSRAEVDKSRPNRKTKAQHKAEKKSLNAQVLEQEEQLIALTQENAALQAKVTALETRLETNSELSSLNADAESTLFNKPPGFYAGYVTQNNDNSASDSDSNSNDGSKPKRRNRSSHRLN